MIPTPVSGVGRCPLVLFNEGLLTGGRSEVIDLKDVALRLTFDLCDDLDVGFDAGVAQLPFKEFVQLEDAC